MQPLLLTTRSFLLRSSRASSRGPRVSFASVPKRWCSTGAQAAQADAAMSLRSKVALFSSFMVLGGGGTFAYMLATDTDFLFKMQDTSPKLVNILAPWIGLPVVQETGELDVEEYFPRNIEEIVGEKLKVACTLRSGRVCLVDAAASASLDELKQLVADKIEADATTVDIVQVDFVNDEEIQRLEAVDEEQISKSFGIKIPEITPSASKKDLRDLLDQCRLLEADLLVQLELSKKYNNDTSQIIRAMEQTEQRKKDIKQLLRKRY